MSTASGYQLSILSAQALSSELLYICVVHTLLLLFLSALGTSAMITKFDGYLLGKGYFIPIRLSIPLHVSAGHAEKKKV
jgi:hypothetical protein